MEANLAEKGSNNEIRTRFIIFAVCSNVTILLWREREKDKNERYNDRTTRRNTLQMRREKEGKQIRKE
jgi:hypothetical protein